jgi:hypothetical protein
MQLVTAEVCARRILPAASPLECQIVILIRWPRISVQLRPSA